MVEEGVLVNRNLLGHLDSLVQAKLAGNSERPGAREEFGIERRIKVAYAREIKAKTK
jgi:hypothetical protein